MKIVQEHAKCIGCGSCAALCSKYWEISDDGKSAPIGSKKDPKGNYELEIKQIECNQDAADACPVQCIKIIK
jgi:ferredoxin